MSSSGVANESRAGHVEPARSALLIHEPRTNASLNCFANFMRHFSALMPSGEAFKLSEIENPRRVQGSLGKLSERDEPPFRRRIGGARKNRRVPAADQNGLARERDLPRRSARREVPAGRRVRPRQAEAELESRSGSSEFAAAKSASIVTACVSSNGPTLRSAQRDDMTIAAENSAHVAGQRTHIRAFTAAGLEHARRSVGHFDERQTVDENRARFEHDASRRHAPDHKPARHRP